MKLFQCVKIKKFDFSCSGPTGTKIRSTRRLSVQILHPPPPKITKFHKNVMSDSGGKTGRHKRKMYVYYASILYILYKEDSTHVALNISMYCRLFHVFLKGSMFCRLFVRCSKWWKTGVWAPEATQLITTMALVFAVPLCIMRNNTVWEVSTTG